LTCIWNKIFLNNVSQFKIRFPELYEILKKDFDNVQSLINEKEKKISEENDLSVLNSIFPFFEFSFSKSDKVTVKENGVYLHSTYNPEKEAEKLFEKIPDKAQTNTIESDDTYIFAGIGLGYAPIKFASKFNDRLLVIIEPDPGYLFASMCVNDFTPVFKTEKCVIITQTQAETVIPLLEQLCELKNTKVITQNSLTQHQYSWFKTFFALLERNKRKEEINTSTLEKFSNLWLKNSAKNLKYFKTTPGISIYKNILDKKFSSIVVAAGPSLEDAIPYLKKIQDKMIIISVDTAVKTLNKNKIKSDFVLLIDPQYYAATHILDCDISDSVLVTESSVYPSVMKVKSRKKVFIESLFPLGRYFETNLLHEKSFGKIIAGGSVSTSCWDFAKYIGSDKIYFTGLDLGYPQKKTHIRGSTFEEKSHTTSLRTKPAENALCSILFNAANEKAKDFEDNEIITDSKMKLFAWWFESQIAKENENRSKGLPYVETYTLSKKGLKIPLMQFCDINELVLKPEIRDKKIQLIKTAEEKPLDFTEKDFDRTLDSLKSLFNELKTRAKRGLDICKKILNEPEAIAKQKAASELSRLNETDAFIMQSEAKKVASLVFPTQRQLEELMQQERPQNSEILINITRSKVIYRALTEAIEKYQKYL